MVPIKAQLHIQSLQSYNINHNDPEIKSIVVWGTNLESAVGYKIAPNNKLLRSMFEVPSYIKSVLVGLILSDAGFITVSKSNQSSNTNYGIQLGVTIKNFNYFWNIYTILSPFCYQLPRLIKHTRNNISNNSIYLTTRMLPCFTNFREFFYELNSKTKEVPAEIYYILDPIALAQWIAGDGKATKSGLTLCTDSFSAESIKHLIIVLTNRYDLICSIHIHDKKKQHYRIYISEKSMNNLREIVKPHLHPSFYYKVKL